MGDGVLLSRISLNSLLFKERDLKSPIIGKHSLLHLIPTGIDKVFYGCINTNFDESCATGSGRDCEVRWIIEQGRKYNVGLNTLGLAIGILDRILCSVKVKSKYLNCVAVSSLFLAVKFYEEPINDEKEEQVDPQYLSSGFRTHYSSQEISRMERSLLSTINWDLLLPTCDRFLLAMLTIIDAPHLAASPPLRCNFEQIISHWTLVSAYRPSVLALSLLSLMLEVTSTCWARITSSLKEIFMVGNQQLAECRKSVGEILRGRENISVKTTKSLSGQQYGSGNCPLISSDNGNSWKSSRKRTRTIFGVLAENDPNETKQTEGNCGKFPNWPRNSEFLDGSRKIVFSSRHIPFIISCK